MYRIGSIARSVVSLLILASRVSASGAQEIACQHRTLPVSFRDARNLPIQDVTIADLVAKVHGKPIKIVSLAPDLRPHRLVLSLDTSGSLGSPAVGERPTWKLEFDLARHFFEANRQKSQIALLFFNDKVNSVIDFSQGNSAIENKFQQIANDRDFVKKNVKGKTALRDAILQGVQLLEHPTSADALYVLTDGGDNVSTHSGTDVSKRLEVTSVRLFAMLLQPETRHHSRPPEEETGPQELSEISRKSGGEILSAASRHGDQVALSANPDAKLKTEETLSRLYQTILQDSLLEIELPSPIAKNEHWELKLSTMARRQRKGVQITYPDTLISCDSEVAGAGRRH